MVKIASNIMSRVKNFEFDSRVGLMRGAGFAKEVSWYIIKMVFFLTPFPWPSFIKVFFLALFGARIGKGVYIKPRVNIHFPWKLQVGDFTWIGEEVFILNLEPVKLGSNVCISQRAFLCTGNHDYKKPSMPYRNRSIVIEDGAWVGAQVFVCPGVRVGTDAVATAGSVVVSDLPEGMICVGNPCRSVKPRWPSES